MLYYMPNHEYEVHSAIFCIIRPVPVTSYKFIPLIFMLMFLFNELELNILRL